MVWIALMVDTERALSVAVRIAEKRAELAALEKEFAAVVEGTEPAKPRIAVVMPAAIRGRPGHLGEQVLRLLAGNPGVTMSPKQIAANIPGAKRKYVQIIASRLLAEGQIARGTPGTYRAKQ